MIATATAPAAPEKTPVAGLGCEAPMMPLEDEDLVSRAQGGDRAAFEELVRRHADRLNAVVLRIAGSNHAAEEVTQETFLRAWRGLAGFKGDASFFTWLYRIGVNEARRRIQAAPAPGTLTSLEEHPFEPRDPGPGPAEASQHRDLRAALEAAVRALDPDSRTALVLRDIEGLSTAEAAAIMGLGEAAFKSRLHRARLTVRTAVNSYLPEDDR